MRSDPVSYHEQLLLLGWEECRMDCRSAGCVSVEYINRKPTSHDRSWPQRLAIMAGAVPRRSLWNPEAQVLTQPGSA
jgi:hypothetical protein